MKKQLTVRELKARKKMRKRIKISSLLTALFVCGILYTGYDINATTNVEKQKEAVTMANSFKEQGYSASDSAKMLKKLFRNIEFTTIESGNDFSSDKLNIYLIDAADRNIPIDTIVFEK